MSAVRASLLFLLALLATPGPAAADALDEQLRGVVADYTGLYTREALPEWRKLFLPSFTAAHIDEQSGEVVVRNLAQFYASQEGYLNSGKRISEVLENTRIERRGRVASVAADFVLTEDGVVSRGQLVLSLVRHGEHYRIQSLVFSYLP